MGNRHATSGFLGFRVRGALKERIAIVRFFYQCEIGRPEASILHRKQIVAEHYAYKAAVKKENVKSYSTRDLLLYMQHMRQFMDSLDSSLSEDDLCAAVDFYTKLDMNVLWQEFEEAKRIEILIRHRTLRELHDLPVAIVRRDYKALIDHKNAILDFASDKPPSYD